jgi:putative transposase
VWQGRFKSFIVQNDVHLLTVLRYIEGNPVRAGLVKSAQDWQWSSHLESSGAKARDIVAASPIELPPAWTEYVDTPLTDEECETVRQSVNRQAPFGRPDWVLKTCRELGLESTIKPKGRPVQKRKKGTGYFI